MITTKSLPEGQAGVPYSTSLQATEVYGMSLPAAKRGTTAAARMCCCLN
jgi:hypothetical protein